MPQSPLRLIRRCAEYKTQEELADLPKGLRGIYVLYRSGKRLGKQKYNVVYVGMTAAGTRRGMLRRLRSHRKNKAGLWTHFSVYEVWDNIRDDEIRELEGLFRHIYKKDAEANRLNVARGFKTMRRVTMPNLKDWQTDVGKSTSPRITTRRRRKTRNKR